MLTLGHYLQITRIIIPLVPVDVVNNLAGFQRSTEHLFSDDAVFVSSVILTIAGGAFVESDLTMVLELLGCHFERRSRSQLFRSRLSHGRNSQSFNRLTIDENISTFFNLLREIIDRLIHSDDLFRSPFAIDLGDVL